MHFYWPLQNGDHALEQFDTQKVLAPFAQEVLYFIQALSKRFVKMRQHPEVVALGYWMRKAHIHELQTEWEQNKADRLIKARGTVFHIAPSNVDTIFVYSWVLSLLAGNRNVIRLSSKEQLQMNILLTTILDELMKPEFQVIAVRTIVLTYPHQDVMTEGLSKLCHTRVVWGGDATVRAVRQIPLAPTANELVFPDRFSMAMVKAEAVNELENAMLLQLVEKFYNDAFWFDQMACSSPRLMIWTGHHTMVKQAQDRFWGQLEQVILAKSYEIAAATQVQKLATGLWLAADPETIKVERNDSFSRIQLNELTAQMRERHCGGGLFYETIASHVSDIANIVVDKDQTLSYFGFNRDELIAFMDNVQTRGIDRIVPIGQALDFQAVWDGQSFLTSFTREVIVI